MISRQSWSLALGAVSCLASLSAGLILFALGSTTGFHLDWTFVMFALATVGALSGIAGLISSQVKGRGAVLSVVGCVLSLLPALICLMVLVVIFGQQH